MQFFLSASNLIETFAHATIICDSAVVNLVISSSLQSSLQLSLSSPLLSNPLDDDGGKSTA